MSDDVEKNQLTSEGPSVEDQPTYGSRCARVSSADDDWGTRINLLQTAQSAHFRFSFAVHCSLTTVCIAIHQLMSLYRLRAVFSIEPTDSSIASRVTNRDRVVHSFFRFQEMIKLCLGPEYKIKLLNCFWSAAISSLCEDLRKEHGSNARTVDVIVMDQLLKLIPTGTQ